MKKSHIYNYKYFNYRAVRRLIAEFQKLMDRPLKYTRLLIRKGDTTWTFGSIEEFIEDYQNVPDIATLTVSFEAEDGYSHREYEMSIDYFSSNYRGSGFTLAMDAPSRYLISRIFEIAEEELPNAISLEVKDEEIKPVIFIGHGRSKEWRDLKDHLADKHHYRIESYESGARAGHTIRDILDDMLSKSNFALLVLTAEDEMDGSIMRARQNVIHETGLFQGRLGFSRAIVLMEEGVEEFSNIFGIQQLRFSKANIKEVFGDVLATLKREFPS